MIFQILGNPKKVLLVSLLFFFGWLVSSQFIYQYYQLWSYQVTLKDKYSQIQQDILDLSNELNIITEKDFIQKHALENLGLIQEQDLVFIFPN